MTHMNLQAFWRHRAVLGGWLTLLLALHLWVLYQCIVISMSDAQGGIIWIGGIPALLIIDTAAVVAVNAYYKTGASVAARIFCVLFGACILVTLGGMNDTTVSVCKSIFVAINGKTPWEAGHGK